MLGITPLLPAPRPPGQGIQRLNTVGPENTNQLKSLTMLTGIVIFERGLQSPFIAHDKVTSHALCHPAALAYLASWCLSRRAMQPEILALRHQLAVYQHSLKRLQLQSADRLFWAWLSATLAGLAPGPGIRAARTVIAWQKKRFRDYWRRLSQSVKPGRPAISKESANSSRTCGERIPRGVHRVSWASCASSASTWPNRR